MTVASSSTVKWGSSRLRVALVLDNTGSMADSGKIAALKTATSKSADPVEERRHRQWRRLCLDRSVREGRQSRPGQLEFGLHLLGHRNGCGAQDPNATDNTFLGRQQRPVRGPGQHRHRHRQQLLAAQQCLTVVLLDFRLHHPEQPARARARARCRAILPRAACTGAGTCSLSGLHQPEQLHDAALARSRATPAQSSCTARALARSPAKQPEQLHQHEVCSKSQYTTRSNCTQHNGTWTAGRWTAGRLDRRQRGRHGDVDGGRVERGHLDAQQPQHLERLRHGPRLSDHAATRSNNYDTNVAAAGPGHATDVVALRGRAIRLLPASRDGPELRLDGDELSWSTTCRPTATPTRRSACSSAGCRWSAAGRSPRRRWIRTTPTRR